MGTYTFAQLEGFWVQAGGDPAAAPTAAAIGIAESGGSDIKQQGQPYSTTGWGIWQITPGNSEPQAGIDGALLNPSANAVAAVSKYNQAGGSFRPWTTFTDKAYLQFLDTSTAPYYPYNPSVPNPRPSAPSGVDLTAGVGTGLSLWDVIVSPGGLGEMMTRLGETLAGGAIMGTGIILVVLTLAGRGDAAMGRPVRRAAGWGKSLASLIGLAFA